jgi:hypothetical protein
MPLKAFQDSFDPTPLVSVGGAVAIWRVHVTVM